MSDVHVGLCCEDQSMKYMVLMYADPAATKAMTQEQPCRTPERARAIAERVLDFHVVAVEVRPVHDSFGMDAA